jgi:hypothetical protein
LVCKPFWRKTDAFLRSSRNFNVYFGFLSALWLGISKLIDVARGIYGHLITNNPWFFIALTMMIMGTLLL